MGEFNSEDHYIYYWGHKSLKRNGIAIIVNKRIQNVALGCNLCLQGKQFNITSNAEEAEVERFYEDLKELLELTPPKYVLFITGDWNTKVGS